MCKVITISVSCDLLSYCFQNIVKEIEKMKASNFTIDPITILSSDLKRELDSFKAANLASVNFTHYLSQVCMVYCCLQQNDIMASAFYPNSIKLLLI